MLEGQNRNKEQDSVGGGDPEPAQECGAPGTSRKEGSEPSSSLYVFSRDWPGEDKKHLPGE